ncbi:MAG: hypothetical protein CMM07_13540 [Rhodopirellula sp.]|nr:hypothetical protein [Rhodopirellula sp.]
MRRWLPQSRWRLDCGSIFSVASELKSCLLGAVLRFLANDMDFACDGGGHLIIVDPLGVFRQPRSKGFLVTKLELVAASAG